MLDVGGQDATEAFEDVGHSDEAREILNGLKIGKLRRVVCSAFPRPKQFHTKRQGILMHCAQHRKATQPPKPLPRPQLQAHPRRTQEVWVWVSTC